MHKHFGKVRVLTAIAPLWCFQLSAHAELTAAQAEAQTELLLMVEQLQREVVELRGIVEQLQYQQQASSEDGMKRYTDTDQRLSKLNERITILEATAQTNSSSTVSAEEAGEYQSSDDSTSTDEKRVNGVLEADSTENEDYLKAYDKIKERDFDGAIDSFHTFLEKHPEGALTPNAYYWLGEVYLVNNQYDQARTSFSIVTDRYTRHAKSSDAYYKLAVIAKTLGEKDEAMALLDKVMEEYPNSNAARLAKKMKLREF